MKKKCCFSFWDGVIDDDTCGSSSCMTVYLQNVRATSCLRALGKQDESVKEQ